MNREQFDSLARHKAGPPKELPDARLDRDFFVSGPHNANVPRDKYPKSKGRSQFGAAGDLEPRPIVPCARNLCDGTGRRLVKENPHTGTKTYAVCACRGGKA